jgi:hypothetical protein
MTGHGRVGYKNGCRCDTCRRAERDYRRAHRAKSRGLEVVPDVPGVDPQATSGSGRVTAAVREEIAMIGNVAERHPGLVESAVAMAAILDDPRLATTQPSAQRRLMAALDQLHKLGGARRGNLSVVANMSKREGEPS